MDLSQAKQFVGLLEPPPPVAIGDLAPELRIFREGPLEAYYAPFDHENAAARLAVVGLTPGWQQAQIAFARFLELREKGCPIATAHRDVKAEASFAGSMRSNLVSMLDRLGLPAALGLSSSDDLFGPARDLLHTTSALRYPVFKHGRNYSEIPRPTRSHSLRAMVDQLLCPELKRILHALIVPLGRAASECLNYLSETGRLSRFRWLSGFPHPSGPMDTAFGSSRPIEMAWRRTSSSGSRRRAVRPSSRFIRRDQ